MTDDDNVRTKPYSTMLKAFTNMVMDLRLFRYADFDFTDENWENRRIGKAHLEVVGFAEKRGWIRFLRDIHDKFDLRADRAGFEPTWGDKSPDRFRVRTVNY